MYGYSKKAAKRHEEELRQIQEQKGNNKCADCFANYPTWASYNLGIFLCGRCASAHKRLGGHISKVKSLSLDDWTPEQIDRMRRIGNRRSNRKWNPNYRAHPFPEEYLDEDSQAVEKYLIQKYVEGAFRNDDGPGFEEESNRDKRRPSMFTSSKNSVSSFFRRSDSKATLGSDDDIGGRPRRASTAAGRPIPKLRFRDPTSDEMRMYEGQSRTIEDMGFTNINGIVEALVYADGNVSEAVEILSYNADRGNTGPSGHEKKPPLPRRKTETAGSSGSARGTATATAATGSTASAGDWWSTNESAGSTSAPSGTSQTVQPLAAAPTGFTGAAGAAQPQYYMDLNNPGQIYQLIPGSQGSQGSQAVQVAQSAPAAAQAQAPAALQPSVTGFAGQAALQPSMTGFQQQPAVQMQMGYQMAAQPTGGVMGNNGTGTAALAPSYTGYTNGVGMGQSSSDLGQKIQQVQQYQQQAQAQQQMQMQQQLLQQQMQAQAQAQAQAQMQNSYMAAPGQPVQLQQAQTGMPVQMVNTMGQAAPQYGYGQFSNTAAGGNGQFYQ